MIGCGVRAYFGRLEACFGRFGGGFSRLTPCFGRFAAALVV